MNTRRVLRVAAAVLFIGAAIGFVALTIVRNWAELTSYDWALDPVELLISTAGLSAVLAWGVYVWHRVLARFGASMPLPALLRVWFLSNLARYIPGKIWQFVGVVQLARGTGIAAPVLLASMVVHVGFSVLSAAWIGLAALPFIYPETDAALMLWITAAATAAALLLVHPAVLNLGLRLVPKALHREVLAWEGTWRDGLSLLMLSVFSWLTYGFFFYVFVDAIVEIPASAYTVLTGVNALAFLAGYFAVVAPGGIGVREAALALLLGPVASAGVGAVVAILSRLWIIAAELIGAGIFWRGSRGNTGPLLP